MKLTIGATILAFLSFSGICKAETKGNLSSGEPPSVVTISVYDRANVPAELLTAAEEEAHRIFLRAGVQTAWLNCLNPLSEQVNEVRCGIIGVGRLVVEILPHAESQQLHFRLGVLGQAPLTDKGEGFHCYLFYDRIERLARERLLKHWLLADVLAHEAGHLLLGSTSHSLNSIMSGQWNGNGLRRVSQGAMFFDPRESAIMRQRLKVTRERSQSHAAYVLPKELQNREQVPVSRIIGKVPAPKSSWTIKPFFQGPTGPFAHKSGSSVRGRPFVDLPRFAT